MQRADQQATQLPPPARIFDDVNVSQLQPPDEQPLANAALRVLADRVDVTPQQQQIGPSAHATPMPEGLSPYMAA
eukprot:13066328-Alexandrium_andersonii.AAC.1